MKRNYLFMIVGIMFLFSFASVLGQPWTQESVEGAEVQIESPIFQYKYLNEEHKFNIHAFNTSDGTQLSNNTTSCYLHLYSGELNGRHILRDDLEYSEGDFYLEVNDSKFNQTGIYSVLFYCSNDDGAGFIQNNFEVIEREKTGVFAFDFDNSINIIIYIVLFVLSILAFILKRQEISSLIMLILGFFMLINGVNTIASLIVISLGVIIAFIGGDD